MEISQKHPLVRLWQYASAYQGKLLIASIFSILNKVFDLAPPALIGAAVDIVVKREDSLIAKLGFEDVSTQLWILGLITLVVWVLESVFEYMLNIYWRNLAQTI